MSEQFQAFASAPGKVLWIGGYSVLERPNISFVTGVDKRVYARAGLKEGNLVELSAPQFKAGWQGPLEEINAAPAELKFVSLSVKATLDYLGAKGENAAGVSLTTLSDPSFGIGKARAGWAQVRRSPWR